MGADSECHSVCPDRRGYCGGGWRNAVYELKDPVDWSRHELEPIGCFRDAEDRDLEHLVSTHVNSPEHCALECRALGYEFIGLQIGRECRCSNSVSYFIIECTRNFFLKHSISQRPCFINCVNSLSTANTAMLVTATCIATVGTSEIVEEVGQISSTRSTAHRLPLKEST